MMGIEVEGRERGRGRREDMGTSIPMRTMKRVREDTGEEEDIITITEEEEEEEEG